MSVSSVSNPLLTVLPTLGRTADPTRPNGTTPSGAGANTVGAHTIGSNTVAASNGTSRAPRSITTAAPTQHAVPAEAPPGTDPTLWSVLTADERAFFAKSASLGPLTYGRLKAATQPAPPPARGVRLDVRA